MPHVARADRPELKGFLERTAQTVPTPLDYVSESVWAEFLADRMTWEPIDEAPRDGSALTVLYEDGTSEDGAYWADHRQCMLGSRAGERGPGWVSTEAGGLPVGDDPCITHFRLPGTRR